MDPFKDLLNKRINKLGLRNTIEAAYIVSVAQKAANQRFVAQSFSRGTLRVYCPDSLSATKVRFASNEIIKEINTALNSNTIKQLHVSVKNQDKNTH